MSKMAASLPGEQIKNSVIGGVISLAVYVVLQFVAALLLYSEIVGERMVYPMACTSAVIASFFGCGYGVFRKEKGNSLGAAAVVVVFLVLTVVAGLLAGGTQTMGAGLTGIGGSMAAGGLAAAMVGGVIRGKRATRYDRKGCRRKKR